MKLPVQRASAIFVLLVAIAISGAAKNPPARPKIFGLTSVTFYSSSISESRAFYTRTVDGSLFCEACDTSAPFVAQVLSGGTIQITKPSGDLPSKLLANVTFSTDNVGQLAKFLKFKNVDFILYKDKQILTLVDPEGNRISFVGPPVVREITLQDKIEIPKRAQSIKEHGPLIRHIRLIHAGFIVHNREAMEHFYEDILGFRPYWHGGMKDDETNWVSLQVPEGTSWLEFMLYDDSNADKRVRGIMNNIALGVTDIHATQEQLRKNGAPLTEEPKIGRDGKWQLNLYDPDGTRIEFMEFTPVQKPCCSDFTAPHPKP